MSPSIAPMAPGTTPPALYPDVAALRAAACLLWEWCARLDEPVKARQMLETLPYLIDDDPEIVRRREIADAMIGHLQSPEHYAWFYDAIWEADAPQSIEDVVRVGRSFPRYRWALQMAQRHRLTTTLDLGMGDGGLVFFLAHHGCNATGVNLTKRCIDAAIQARRRVWQHDWVAFRTQFVFADAESYRGPSPVAMTTAFEILEHVRDPDALIATMEANTQPGGYCLLTTPNGCTTYGQDQWAIWERIDFPLAHVRVYTARRMRDWLGHKEEFDLHIQPGAGDGLLAVSWRRAAGARDG